MSDIKLQYVDQLPASEGYPYVLVKADGNGAQLGQIPAGTWTPKDQDGEAAWLPLEEAIAKAREFAELGGFKRVLLVAPGIAIPDSYGAEPYSL